METSACVTLVRGFRVAQRLISSLNVLHVPEARVTSTITPHQQLGSRCNKWDITRTGTVAWKPSTASCPSCQPNRSEGMLDPTTVPHACLHFLTTANQSVGVDATAHSSVPGYTPPLSGLFNHRAVGEWNYKQLLITAQTILLPFGIEGPATNSLDGFDYKICRRL